MTERDPDDYIFDDEERERMRLEDEARDRECQVKQPRPRRRPVMMLAAMAIAAMSGMPGMPEIMGSPFDDPDVRRRARPVPEREPEPLLVGGGSWPEVSLLEELRHTDESVYRGSLQPEPVFITRARPPACDASEQLRRQVKREADARHAKLVEVKRRRREGRSA